MAGVIRSANDHAQANSDVITSEDIELPPHGPNHHELSSWGSHDNGGGRLQNRSECTSGGHYGW
jgi:hypothetical protein